MCRYDFQLERLNGVGLGAGLDQEHFTVALISAIGEMPTLK